MTRAWISGLALAVAFSTVACGDGGDGGDVDPAPGTWTYAEYAASTNTCKIDQIVTNGRGDFKLQNNGDGTLTIDPQDGTKSFTCTLSGSSLTCPERAAADTTTQGITAKAKVTVTGTFSDDKSFSGTQNGSVTCTGAACATVTGLLGITFPCTFTVSFKATFKG
jgi:hypothetical protein